MPDTLDRQRLDRLMHTPIRGGQDPPEGDPPPADGDPPKPADQMPQLSELQAALAGLSKQVETLQTSFGAVVADTQARAARSEPPAPKKPRVTDQEINDAYASGNVAEVMRRLQQETVEELVEKHVAPLQHTGIEAISGLTLEVTKGSMKYYPKFKAQIDEYVKNMGPDGRMNPAAIRAAHDIVAGQNIEAIVAEEVEKRARQAADAHKDAANIPGGKKRVDASGQEVPSVEQLFGVDAANALRSKGESEDQFAQKLGYANWEAYVKVYQKQEADMQGGTA